MSMPVSSSKMDNLQELQTAYLIAIAELEATKQDVTKLKQQHIESTLTIASLKEEIARLMEQLLLLKASSKKTSLEQLSPSFLSSLPAEFKHIIKRRKRK